MTKPWESEPNFEEFEYKEFRCFIERNHAGALCGYVNVQRDMLVKMPPLDYGGDFDVHGGITWNGIKPIPTGEQLYLIGFDCAHSGDFCPKLSEAFQFPGNEESYSSYKDINYVRSEIKSLADQILCSLI